MHPGFAPGRPIRKHLPGIWSTLLDADQLAGGLIVEGDGQDTECVAFGIAVFVSDAFVDDVLAAPKPYLAEHVYSKIIAHRSPVLTVDEVRTRNTSEDGLNLLILHYGQAVRDLSDPRAQAILSAAHTGWRLAFDGYSLRRILEEVAGDQVDVKRAAGLHIKSSYPTFAWSGSPSEQPFLMGLFREDPESRLPGSSAASIFQYRAPRFSFSLAEQRVLTTAVFEEADDGGVARRLGISSGAVRQAWRRIYARVTEVAPTVLGGDVLIEAPRLTRGREKRRRLIEYLRFHPEELRPTLRSVARRTNRMQQRTGHGRGAGLTSLTVRTA